MISSKKCKRKPYFVVLTNKRVKPKNIYYGFIYRTKENQQPAYGCSKR